MHVVHQQGSRQLTTLMHEQAGHANRALLGDQTRSDGYMRPQQEVLEGKDPPEFREPTPGWHQEDQKVDQKAEEM